MLKGTHEFEPDARNADIQVYVNGELVPRDAAAVSVFDSGFLLGDGVWEGIRLHRGRILFLEEHLDRLYAGATAIDLDIGLSREALASRLMETVAANGMTTDVHIRLVVTRGLKTTPYQHPAANIGGPTIVIIPEHKVVSAVALSRGIRLFTVHVRRGAPDGLDPKLNSLSKLNCITACIQADKAGADEALMLDPHGFVSTCNSTNFFVVRRGVVWTSTGRYCLNGVTRANIIRLCWENKISKIEGDFSLVDVYAADEAFVTGTFAGVIPVVEVDGRGIGDGLRGPITNQLQELYASLVDAESTSEGASR